MYVILYQNKLFCYGKVVINKQFHLCKNVLLNIFYDILMLLSYFTKNDVNFYLCIFLIKLYKNTS